MIVTDGMLRTNIMIWTKELAAIDRNLLVKDAGIRVIVDYDSERNSFSLRRNTNINMLKAKIKHATAD